MNDPIHAPDFPYDFQWINTVHPLSLYDDLQGYVVLVHFWTASNVNCHHVFPMLAWLEQRFADRSFVVVGVHTGKFSAERDPDRVTQAVRRFGLRHPVVIDEAGEIWKSHDARAWPFLSLIDAAGQLRFQGAGEPDLERMAQAIEFLLDEAAAEGDEPYTELQLDENDAPEPADGLRFPAGLAWDAERELLWVADSGRHRVLAVAPADGAVRMAVGTGEPGAADGGFAEASFSHPQALAVVGDAVLVADAGNHLLRRIDVHEARVDSVLGTNRPVVDREGGGSGPAQPINSPWGLALRDDELFVAMAGQHQIWRVELDTMTAAPFAGSDTKGAHDGTVFDAALAQPAGLALHGDRLYFVDSDSSALRCIDFTTGEVSSPIAGGLYVWGQQDGSAPRLQFPRDLAWHGSDLWIADTGNDAVRRWRDGRLETLAIELAGPEGLAVVGDTLFIADTGHHRLVRVDLAALPTGDTLAGVQPEVEVLNLTGVPAAPTGFCSAYRPGRPIRLPPLGECRLRLPLALSAGAQLVYETRPTLDASNIEGHPLLVDITLHPDVDGGEFVAHGVATGEVGEGVVRCRLSYLSTQAPGRVCHLHERRIDVPVTIVADAEPDATVLAVPTA